MCGRFRIPKGTVAMILCSFSLIGLFGCGARVPPLEVWKPYSIESKFSTLDCGIHPSYRVIMKELKMTVDIVDAQIDTSGNYLCFLYEMDKNSLGLMALSTSSDSIMQSFRVPNDTSIRFVRSGLIGLQESEKLLLIDLFSGYIIKELPGYYSSIQFENEMLRTTIDSLWLYDQTSGNMLWTQYWSRGDAPLARTWRINDHIFIANDGLWCTRITDGTGWHYFDNTWSISRLRQVAGCLLQGCLSALSPSYYGGYSTPSADYTYGLFSNPLPVEDKVFFASGEHLSCLSQNTGELLWQKTHQDRVGTSCLFALNNSVGVMVQFGTDILNGDPRETKNPYVSAFDLQSGDEMWHFVPEPFCSIKEALAWNGLCAILTDSTFYVIDQKGDLLLNEATLDLGFKPTKIVDGDRRLLVFGEKNIAAWTLGSLKKLWQIKTGKIHNVLNPIVSIDWYEVLFGRTLKGRYLKADSNYLWILEEDETVGSYNLKAYDLTTGSCERLIALSKSEAEWKSGKYSILNNHFVLFWGRRLCILWNADVFGNIIRHKRS